MDYTSSSSMKHPLIAKTPSQQADDEFLRNFSVEDIAEQERIMKQIREKNTKKESKRRSEDMRCPILVFIEHEALMNDIKREATLKEERRVKSGKFSKWQERLAKAVEGHDREEKSIKSRPLPIRNAELC